MSSLSEGCALAPAFRPKRLIREPDGFKGLGMSQKVADANDLPRSKVKDLSDFLAELDAGRPGSQLEVTERED